MPDRSRAPFGSSSEQKRTELRHWVITGIALRPAALQIATTTQIETR